MTEKSKQIWTFNYEPKTLDEMVLSNELKPRLQKIIDEVPNLFLYGNQGIGKGTFVNILLNQTGYDYIKLNASDENSVDDVRTKIKSFATSLGLTELKIVYLNEADRLTANACDALLDLMERVQNNTRFIFVGNHFNLTPELKSRCQVVKMENPPPNDIYYFCMNILQSEEVEVKNKKSVVSVIKNLYPDIRHIINTLQLNTVDGKIEEVVYSSNEDLYKEIHELIKSKKIQEVRKKLKSHIIDYPELYAYLFENVGDFSSPADMIIKLGEALRWDSQVAIKEINLISKLTEAIKEGIV